jgi:glycosyltransferase involved in cell wall biosynthesis
MVRDSKTGLTFEPGNADDLRSKIEFMINNPQFRDDMGRGARLFAETEYSPETHYRKLLKIYENALNEEETRYSRN